MPAMRMEDVAEDAMDYLRKRDARRTQLMALLAEQNNPVLLQYPFLKFDGGEKIDSQRINKGLINAYVTSGIGSTTRSVVDTLVHQFNAHKPRLEFLRKHLEHSAVPLLYETLVDKYPHKTLFFFFFFFPSFSFSIFYPFFQSLNG
jgi:hypothetical protein